MESCCIARFARFQCGAIHSLAGDDEAEAHPEVHKAVDGHAKSGELEVELQFN